MCLLENGLTGPKWSDDVRGYLICRYRKYPQKYPRQIRYEELPPVTMKYEKCLEIKGFQA